MGSRFKQYVTMLPGSWEKVLGHGLRFFISRQDPDDVKFVKYDNGWGIQVVTDEDNVEEASDFWDEYVREELEE